MVDLVVRLAPHLFPIPWTRTTCGDLYKIYDCKNSSGCQQGFPVVSTITAHSYASYLAVATVCQDELNHLAALGGDDAIVETDFLKSVSAM
uniref:Uncharacterized protein n=1 Tax=Oryza nivara TaxID=4536 RepID=A0A0E0J0N9_ORYNI